ncbi:HAD family hydrolase [Salsipaludibacter albus]|uniref:HAD family hydrolase n=1 Tax=Salsipaludibacter albus TaxID=2849650 RepID=UPI001EE41711|nr:HAD family hydrolase [Salsipaludibacter albus]MBY5163185.1 HAD family hydrolase [Salsipaludibacter albus]
MMTNTSEPTTPETAGVVLDLDGTLVDSVWQHVVAWQAALAAAGHDVAQARIHAGIGMGSDRLVPWLLGDDVDDAADIAQDHTRRFLDLSSSLRPTRGAHALLADLERRDVPFVVATSAGGDERSRLLEVLGRSDLPVTDAEEVDSSKPAPDLVLAGCRQGGFAPDSARMVGDAPWDAVAAVRAGATAIAVRCGGFPDAVLREGGATRIVDDPAELVGQL